jgi:hypothetical protein
MEYTLKKILNTISGLNQDVTSGQDPVGSKLIIDWMNLVAAWIRI